MRLALLRLTWLLANRIAVTSILAASAIFLPTLASALSTGSEFVRGTLFTPAYTVDGTTFGPFGGDFSYVRSFDGSRVEKDIQISFVFDQALGFGPPQQATYRATVEANIEGIWNNKFVIVDTSNKNTFPVAVDVATTGPTFDQTVAVHPGPGRANQVNWFVTDSASVNAHEFGHMLGLFDEYIGGAIDRFPNPTLTDTGLMGLGALLQCYPVTTDSI